MEVPVREKEIAEKKKEKEMRLSMEMQQNQAYVLLAQGKGSGGGPGGTGPYVYSSKDLEVLLKWHGKTLKEMGSKSKRLDKWADIVANQQLLKISSPEARWWRLPQPTAIRWTQIERYTVIGNLLLIEL